MRELLALSIPLAAVVLSLSIPIVVIIAVFYSKYRRERLWHETARLAIEKGQPVPAHPSDESLQGSPPPAGTNLAEWDRLRRANRRRKDVRIGLILLAVGLGLYFAWHQNGMRNYNDGRALASFILIGLGAAFTLNSLIDGLFSRKSGDSGDRPPQS